MPVRPGPQLVQQRVEVLVELADQRVEPVAVVDDRAFHQLGQATVHLADFERSRKLSETLVHGLQPVVDRLQPPVNPFEVAVDPFELAFHTGDPAVEAVQPPVDPVDLAVDAFETAVEAAFERVEAAASVLQAFLELAGQRLVLAVQPGRDRGQVRVDPLRQLPLVLVEPFRDSVVVFREPFAERGAPLLGRGVERAELFRRRGTQLLDPGSELLEEFGRVRLGVGVGPAGSAPVSDLAAAGSSSSPPRLRGHPSRRRRRRCSPACSSTFPAAACARFKSPKLPPLTHLYVNFRAPVVIPPHLSLSSARPRSPPSPSA